MFQSANQVIVKLTKGCNLRCKYCYVNNKDENNDIFMSLSTFQNIIDRIVEDKNKNGNCDNSINILFHGGEPTRIDKSTFYNMCEYAKFILNKNNIKAVFSIQTNLTLIDEDWCRLFSAFDISVGFSWDGLKEGNTFRNSFDEKFYLDKIKLLKLYHIKYGCLFVVNKKNISRINESLKFIEEEFGNETCKVNYSEDLLCDFNEQSEIEVTGFEYFRDVLSPQVCQYIETGKCSSFDVEIIIERFLIDYITNKENYYPENGNCYIKYCGGGINVLEVEPDGKVMMCGRYGDDYSEASLDTSSDFLSLKQIRKLLDFQKEKIKAMKELNCDSCSAQNICDHGCMAFYLTKSKNHNKSDWGIRSDIVCNIYKPLYSLLVKNFNDIFNAYFINHKSLSVNANDISSLHSAQLKEVIGSNYSIKESSIEVKNA